MIIRKENLKWFRANEDLVFDALWDSGFCWNIDNVNKTLNVSIMVDGNVDNVTNRFIGLMKDGHDANAIYAMLSYDGL